MALIPTLPTENIIDMQTGEMPESWKDYFQLITQALRHAIGNEGFEIPPQNQANVNVIEPKALTATVLFNSSIVNGGTTDAPNGQLLVKLADGTFHAIPNL